MPSAFFTGLSGLQSHSQAVQVVANNLANLNTIAFKGSRSDFRDLFYQSIGQSRSGVVSQVGIGTAPITVFRRFEQGTVQNTGGLLDAAIQGEGFFVLSDNDLTQYTRAGNFQLNANRELVTINAENVLGWVRDPSTGRIAEGEEDVINLQGQDRIEPSPTTTLEVDANLQTGSTASFSRPVEIFDSLGSSHVMTLTFTPVDPTTLTAGSSAGFEVSVTLPADEVIDTVTGVAPLADPNLVVGQPLVLEFDATGQLITTGGPGVTAIDIEMASQTPPIAFANNAQDLDIAWDLLDAASLPRITSVAAASAITDLFQDGTPSAELVSISMADGGVMNGLYSDGRTLELAQLAMARFTNTQALQAVGSNNYVRTAAAGEALVGLPNEAGRGSIIGLSLETSNVDIAQEFTNLLTYQRGFQANSRVITTADELNQEALNLKR